MSNTIASLVANISANTSGLEAGLSRAKGMMQQTAGEMKNLAANSFTAQGAMDGWSKSKYAAAAAGSMLTDRAYALEKAVSSGKMSAVQATREFNAYRNELQQGVWQTMTFGEKANVMRQKLSEVATVAAKVTAAGVAVGYVAKQGYDLARAGAEIGYTVEKFDRLAVSAGTTSGVFLNELRGATKGTLSDFQLMRQGSDLLQLGLAKDSEEAVRLSRVMTALGMDTGELTLALANQSKRRLDQLGLSLSAFNKVEEKLKGSGLSKEDAFKEAFLQTAESTMSIIGNRADSSLGSFMRLEASASNLWNTFKQTLPERSMGWLFGGDTVSETAEKVGMFMSGMDRLMKRETVFDMNAGNGMWVRQAQAQDLSSLWQLPTPTARPAGISDAQWRAQQMRARETPVTGLSALQSYTAQAFTYGGGVGGAEEQAAAAAETEAERAARNQALLTGAMQATAGAEQYENAQKKLKQATYDLNLELAVQEANLKKISEKYGESSQKTKDQAEKVAEVKNKIVETQEAQRALGDQYAQSGNEMLMSTMQNMGATDEQMLKFAQASGVITHEAAQQQRALMSISDALMSGKITGDQATAAVAKLMSYDGKNARMVIDIYINYIISGGGGKKGGPPPGVTPAMGDIGLGGDAPVVYTNTGTGTERFGNQTAAGGPLNEINMVGEKGWEYVVKQDNGEYMVIPHEASVWMEAAGIMPANRLYTGGMLGEAGIQNWTPTTSTTTTRRSASRTANKAYGPTQGGGGGYASATSGGSAAEISAIVAETAGAIAPAIVGTIASVTQNSIVSNPQIQALTASLDEIKMINENLVSLIAKTASAPDIGRAVNGDLARQA